MEYAVETFALTKIFSDFWGRDKVCAVDDLNLKVLHNEVFGLLGPNGSGKTTTLKMLLGLLYPTKGKAIVLGGDATDTKISARIGFLPEESYLYRYLNARETLDFYGRLFRLPSKVRKMRIEALLDMVGLTAVANRPVGTYSKGMARRIGLAQALINDPYLLILDEPTTGLDPIGTRQIKDLILELAKRGKTVLLCSHLLADVEDVCDRIAILYGGKIQIEGRVKELLQQTHKKQIITDDISDTAVEKIMQIIRQERSNCVVTSPMDKLETFFIKTVSYAEQQAQPTSGAVGTGHISEFLVPQAPAEDILNKLVANPVSKQPREAEPLIKSGVTTKQVVPPESPETKPDDRLLHKLTQPTEQVHPAPVEQPTAEPADGKVEPLGNRQLVRGENEKDKTESSESQTSQQEKIKQNILDQLTNQSTAQKDDGIQSDKPCTGEATDA